MRHRLVATGGGSWAGGMVVEEPPEFHTVISDACSPVLAPSEVQPTESGASPGTFGGPVRRHVDERA